jgi:hypothetical protein
MRTWTLANGPIGTRTGKGADTCGCCGRQVPNGEPIQVITFAGVAKVRKRCAACAVGQVDMAQIEAARLEGVRRDEPASTFQPLRLISKTVRPLFDAKAKAAGE